LTLRTIQPSSERVKCSCISSPPREDRSEKDLHHDPEIAEHAADITIPGIGQGTVLRSLVIMRVDLQGFIVFGDRPFGFALGKIGVPRVT
jgi:hypothetical protein